MATPHIESKKEDVAKIVLMPGDPKRAEFIANNYLTDAKLVNSVRGITAYTGYYKNKRVTIFPSGMGNPSVGIYSYELFKFYDVEAIIRIGSAGGYQEHLKLNDIILVDNSYSDSNYAKVICDYPKNNIKSDKKLNNIIINTAKELEYEINIGNIYCSDVFYEKKNTYKDKVKKYDVLGVEMESFGLFTNAKLLKKKAACILSISNSFCYKEELTSEARQKGFEKMILLALETSLKL